MSFYVQRLLYRSVGYIFLQDLSIAIKRAQVMPSESEDSTTFFIPTTHRANTLFPFVIDICIRLLLNLFPLHSFEAT